MKIKLTKKESEQFFYNALCNGVFMLNGYGLLISVADDKDYVKARNKLKNPCLEDIWMQVLRDGGELKITDIEGDYSKKITLTNVHKRVSKVNSFHLLNMAKGYDDGLTADAIIQTVFYKEIIFG